MKFSIFTRLILVAVISFSLFACGGGGGGGAAAPAPAAPTTVTLTADKMTAVTPILNGGSTTITFNFGAPNAGKTVTFTASPAATLTPPSTVLDNLGKAFVGVSAAPSNATINVTASIAGYTGTKAVQFIQQPNKVEVQIATDQTITNLTLLTFGLRSELGNNFVYNGTYTAITSLANTLPVLFSPQSPYIWFVNSLGLNVSPTGASPATVLFNMTFDPDPLVVSAGVPHFEIYAATNDPQSLSATYTDVANGNALIIKPLLPTNLSITTKYILNGNTLATN